MPFEKKDYDHFYIATDKQERLWLATENEGLWYYLNSQETFVKYHFDSESKTINQTLLFRTIFADSKGDIWLGSDGKGLYHIDTKNLRFTNYQKNPSNPYSLTENTVREIAEDINGNIWLIPKGGIINILPNTTNDIAYYSGSVSGTPQRVLSMLKTKRSDLYIGTDGSGLVVVLKDGTKKTIHAVTVGFVQSMIEDDQSNLWIGSYQNGLYHYNPHSDKATKITTGLHGALDVRTVFRDSKNRIWVGTTVGLRVFDSKMKLLAMFDFSSKGLYGNQITAIAQTADGTLWVAGTGGLFKFIESDEFANSRFKKRVYSDAKKVGIHDYLISEIRTLKNTLWLRCQSGFLIQLDTQKGTLESYVDHPVLKNIEILSCLFEDDNNIWMSSRAGLHHYNFDTKTLHSYGQVDGMQGNTYVSRASYRSHEGTLYFGGENGVSAFFPNKLEIPKSKPRLFINQIEVLNKNASIIIPDQVSQNTNIVKKINLSAKQASFSFSFFALDNILNPDFNYKYRLKGFDKAWIMGNKDRRATYTNIPHGHYTFQVKAFSKNAEITPVLKEITLRIAPYWWQTKLAYAIYTLIIMGLLYGYFAWNSMRNKLIREAWEHNKDREVHAAKMDFFAKMAHEIQTPLTLILAPLDNMQQQAPKRSLLYQRLTLIKNNAQKLSRIATDLTTLRNKTLDRLKLYVSQNDLRNDLNNTALGFIELANLKHINFEINLPESPILLWYDSMRLEHAFYNLLSNAFKFTATGGKIILKLTQETEGVSVSVIDNGSGISETDQKAIFRIFYQSDNGRQVQGTGIGLALSKELIEMHRGTLGVVSTLGQGAHFKAWLSYGKKHLENRSDVVFVKKKQATTTMLEAINYEKPISFEGKNQQDQSTHHVLIVEDNIEMQVFLVDFLGHYFNVTAADNGKQALKKLEKEPPDLIISDVMMPEMDGIELSKRILKNKRFKHIPIILLTAKVSNDSRLTGLRAGAISYIQKPFSPAEIYTQAKNLLQKKADIISRYTIDHSTKGTLLKSHNKDTQFINTLAKHLQENIGNPDFKLEDLSDKMAVSYSVIFRKCRELTGMKLTEYFRTIKLKTAAHAIVKSKYRVSEAAYHTGYSDSKYFSKSFKALFKMTPSEFKKKVKQEQLDEFLEKY